MRRSSAWRGTLLGVMGLVLPILLGACQGASSSAPPAIPVPVIGTSSAAASSSGGGATASPSRVPAPGSTSVGPGQPVPTRSARTGAAQRATLQPGTEHNHCRPGSTNRTQTYADPPYQFDAGGEGVPTQASEMITYCGPGAWVVTPRSTTDPYGLPTFTPSISRHVGIPASAVTPNKQIVVDFSEQSEGNNPYAFEMATEFNATAQVPIDVRVMTNDHGAPPPVGNRLSGTTINGMPYRVYGENDSQLRVFTFVPEINQTAGTYDIAPYIRYALSHGWVPGGARLDYVAYLLEVFKIDGTQPFNVNRFSVWMN